MLKEPKLRSVLLCRKVKQINYFGAEPLRAAISS